jgi:hypothetical protein
MTDRLPSGDFKYPSHRWGLLAKNPTLEIGATGEAWIAAVRSAWLKSGGNDQSFALVFPQYARHEATPTERP